MSATAPPPFNKSSIQKPATKRLMIDFQSLFKQLLACQVGSKAKVALKDLLLQLLIKAAV